MAENTIDLAIFSFNNKGFTDEIIKAQKRGVSIRIVTNRTQAKKGDQPRSCADSGVAVRLDASGHTTQHNFMVIDDLYVLLIPLDWPASTIKHDYSSALVIDGQYYIQEYSQEFRRLWNSFQGSTLEDSSEIDQESEEESESDCGQEIEDRILGGADPLGGRRSLSESGGSSGRSGGAKPSRG